MVNDEKNKEEKKIKPTEKNNKDSENDKNHKNENSSENNENNKKSVNNKEKKYTEDEINNLKEKLAKSEEELEKKDEELAEYVSHSQRLQADFENFKKQNEKQKQELIKFANEALITNLLDSYEDLERALESSNTKEELEEGVKLIYSKMKNTLEKEGLCEIPAKNEKFDPFKHEALMVEKSPDHENGQIIEELMKGYTLKDKVIKYSKVKVCKK